MTQTQQNKAHAGTIADYLQDRQGHLWTRDATERVLAHVKQVEDAYMDLIRKLYGEAS